LLKEQRAWFYQDRHYRASTMFQTPALTEPFLPPEPPEKREILPGFGLPLDFYPVAPDAYGIKKRSLFPTAVDNRDIDRGYIEYGNRFFAPCPFLLLCPFCKDSPRLHVVSL